MIRYDKHTGERKPMTFADWCGELGELSGSAAADSMTDDCESLGSMDWETVARECSKELKGDDCLCAALQEIAEKAVDKIRSRT